MKLSSRVFCLLLAVLMLLSAGCTKKEEDLKIPKGWLRRIPLGNREVASKYLYGPNQCEYDFVKDKKEGNVLKLSTSVESATDPYIHFNLFEYLKEIGEKDLYADDFDVVMLKVRVEKMTGSNFELYYSTGLSSEIKGGYSSVSIFDNSDDKWQYIFFDMTNDPNWYDLVNTLRFDFTTAAVSKGESMYISEILFAKNMDTALKVMGIKPNTELDKKLDKETEKYVRTLLSVKEPVTEYSKYKPLKAANEDKKINMWFNHTYTRTPEDVTKPGEMNTYQLRLAKNELESCQLILSSKNGYTDMTLEITDFTNKNGKKLRTELFEGHYFEVRDEMIIDPLPPLQGAFDLKANKSKSFVIKVKSTPDTEPGEYVATVTLKDSNGREVKKANVYAYVWDFELPEKTSCKTLMDLSW